MNKNFLVVIVAILVSHAAPLEAASTFQQQPVNLSITSLQPATSAIGVGQPVVFAAKLENRGSETIPATKPVSLRLTFTRQNLTIMPQCEQSINHLELAPKQAIEVQVNCGLLFAGDGDYTVKPELWMDNQLQPPPDPANTQIIENVHVAPYTTALPDQLARVFAGLGLFSAMMAIMALGTEVVIDTLRVLLGMKSKLNATDALAQFEALIPGKLAALGTDIAAQEEVRLLTTRMRLTLKPVMNAEKAVEALCSGQLKSAFELVTLVSPKLKNDIDRIFVTAGDDVDKLKTDLLALIDKAEKDSKQQAYGFLDQVVNTVQTVMGVDAGVTTNMRNRVALEIDALNLDACRDAIRRLRTTDPSQMGVILESLSKVSHDVARAIHDYSPDLVTDWLRSKRDLNIKTQQENVRGQLAAQVAKLKNLGLLTDAQVTAANQHAGELISGAVAAVETATGQVINSLDNLLNGIEARRNDMQSPARKLWRRLRESPYGDWLIAAVAGILVTLLCAFVSPESKVTIIQILLSIGLQWASLVIVLAAAFGAMFWVYLTVEKRAPALNKLMEKRTKMMLFVMVGFAVGLVFILTADAHWERFISAPSSQFGWLVLSIAMGLLECAMLLALMHALALIGELIYFRDHFDRRDSFGEPDRWMPDKFHDLHRIEVLWNTLRAEDVQEPDDFGKPRTVQEIVGTNLTAENAAQVVATLSDLHRDQEAVRVRWLRAISVLVGLVLAYILQIDAAKLLDQAIPGIERVINFAPILTPKAMQQWIPGALYALTPGIILTGLAASAGSAFWHDQLDRLQASKKKAEGAAQLLNQVQCIATGG